MSHPTPAEDLQPSGGSYDDIVRSSTLIGGSSLLSVAIGVVRNKALALLLGPAGWGLFAIYNSILAVAQTIAGVGISDSGVRQIAQAVGSQDEDRIALTAAVLRRTAFVLGILGTVLLLILARPVARLTFGNAQHASALALLAVAVLLLVIGDGQMALIHGLRQIGNLARLGVLRALLGALITIPLIWFMRDRGILPAIVAAAAVSVLLSWFYTRRNRFRAPALHAGQIWSEFRVLIGMGFALMTGMAMHDGTAWAMKIFLLRQVSYAAAGYYQAAMNLGVFYVGFILAGMGADFYPRLSEAAADNATCIRRVNEQTLAGLLLGAPGLLATPAISPASVG